MEIRGAGLGDGTVRKDGHGGEEVRRRGGVPEAVEKRGDGDIPRTIDGGDAAHPCGTGPVHQDVEVPGPLQVGLLECTWQGGGGGNLVGQGTFTGGIYRRNSKIVGDAVGQASHDGGCARDVGDFRGGAFADPGRGGIVDVIGGGIGGCRPAESHLAVACRCAKTCRGARR
ncbi:MAG: hypothetical protein ABSB32_13110, partial [Thermodesulfobacteriota bacterium]